MAGKSSGCSESAGYLCKSRRRDNIQLEKLQCKKNHVEPKLLKPFDTYDRFIIHFYAQLLRANMYGEYDKLRAFNSMLIS